MGLVGDEILDEILEHYLTKNVSDLLKNLQKLKSGKNPEILASELIRKIREKLAEKPELVVLADKLLKVAKSSHPDVAILTALVQRENSGKSGKSGNETDNSENSAKRSCGKK